jgi:septal ring-binding cell division protein DamX/type II secretory pathway predicted ATPase ExeA
VIFMQEMPDQTQRMLDYYGLARDPFGEDVDAAVFSGVAERSDTVEQLKHLLTFSPQDCLLMAPAEGGKRHLANEVLRRFDDEWRVAWLNADSASQLDVICRELIGQLGLGLRVDSDTASLFRNIANAVAQRTSDGENFLLVVEHADRWSVDVQSWVESLHSLAEQPDLRMRQLWLAESATAIEQASNDELWSVLVLEPFTESDAAGYLRDRFAAAGHLEGAPIEARDIARLNDLAHGLPGHLNQVVSDYLIAGTFKTTERRQGFPLTHVLAGSAVVSLLVLVFLYSRGGEDTTPVEVEPDTQVSAASSEVQQRLAEAVARVEARQQEAGTASDEAQAPVQPAEPETSPVVQPTDTISVPETPLPPAPAEPEPTPAPIEPPVAPATNINSVLPGWLATASDARYTLQLLGVRNRASIARLVEQQADPSQFGILPTQLDGRPWYVLVYGLYPDSATARSDIPNLPENFSDQSPWARNVADLKASVSVPN